MRITIARTGNKAWFGCGYHAYFTYGERHTLLMTSSLLFVVFYRSAGGELHEIPVPPADYLPSLFHVICWKAGRASYAASVCSMPSGNRWTAIPSRRAGLAVRSIPP
jgi:hypothetical protein